MTSELPELRRNTLRMVRQTIEEKGIGSVQVSVSIPLVLWCDLLVLACNGLQVVENFVGMDVAPQQFLINDQINKIQEVILKTENMVRLQPTPEQMDHIKHLRKNGLEEELKDYLQKLALAQRAIDTPMKTAGGPDSAPSESNKNSSDL